MRDDDGPEGRLRELLRDPGWSLPPWPDAQARIRRAARRQRAKAAGLAAGTGAIVATAVAVPLALSGGTVPRAPGTVPAPAAAGRASATPSAQRPPIHFVMPDVAGLELKAAEAVLHALVPQPDVIVRHVRTSGPAGIVIAQIPAPGAHVARDKRITLEVSSAS